MNNLITDLLAKVDERIDAAAEKIERKAEITVLTLLRDAIDGKIQALNSNPR